MKNLNTLQVNYFKELFKKLNYKFFDTGIYNLNLIAVRKQESNNKFNDFLYVIFKDELDEWITYQFKVTTKPGEYYLLNPMQSKGTAIIVPGQYEKAYKLGIHKTYPALVQHLPLPVYRDNNKDTIHTIDPTSIQKGLFGVNIHHATSEGTSTNVDKWSAGCIVFANILEWDLFYDTLLKSQKLYGDTFTLTLLDESQL